jgi:hypothetical protein
MMCELVLARVVVAVCVVAAGAVASAAGAEQRSGEAVITCTNPASGATWQIKIDYDRDTVDSNPARIDDTSISWHDAGDGWSYKLDRRNGNLTAVVASATGGNFLHDRCALAD